MLDSYREEMKQKSYEMLIQHYRDSPEKTVALFSKEIGFCKTKKSTTQGVKVVLMKQITQWKNQTKPSILEINE